MTNETNKRGKVGTIADVIKGLSQITHTYSCPSCASKLIVRELELHSSSQYVKCDNCGLLIFINGNELP